MKPDNLTDAEWIVRLEKSNQHLIRQIQKGNDFERAVEVLYKAYRKDDS